MSTVRDPGGTSPQSADRMATVRLVAAIVITVVVTIFAVLNSQTVQVHWIVTTTSAPLILVIVICAVLGLAVGVILGRRWGHSKTTVD